MRKKSNELKRLQSVWDKKLKKSGFEDLEDRTGRLKQRANNCYRQQKAVQIENKQLYFDLVATYLHREYFTNSTALLIMTRRAEGHSIKEISEEIGNLRKKPTLFYF